MPKKLIEKRGYDRVDEKDFESRDISEFLDVMETSRSISDKEEELLSSIMLNAVKNDNSKGVVIILGGPPHSGKSCLSRFLKLNLNSRIVKFLDMTPDGENQSAYATNSSENQLNRNKKSFSSGFNNMKIDELQKARKQFPIVIADIGGMIDSPDKPAIYSEADFGIILSNNQKDMTSWEKKFKENNIHPLACIESSLEPLPDKITHENYSHMSTLRGVMTNLDRDKLKEHSELTDTLLMIINNSYMFKNGFPPEVEKALDRGSVDLDIFADMFNQKRGNNGIYEWKPEAILPTIKELTQILGVRSNVNFINARAQFLVAALTQHAKDMGIDNIKMFNQEIREINQYTKMKPLPKDLSDDVTLYQVLPSKGLEAIVTESEKAIHLQFIKDSSKERIMARDLKKLKLPVLDKEKELIISGEAFPPLMASTIFTYDNREKYVLQSGMGLIQVGSAELKNIGKQTLGHKDINLAEGKYLYDCEKHKIDPEKNKKPFIYSNIDPAYFLEITDGAKDYLDIPSDLYTNDKHVKDRYTIAEILRCCQKYENPQREEKTSEFGEKLMAAYNKLEARKLQRLAKEKVDEHNRLLEDAELEAALEEEFNRNTKDVKSKKEAIEGPSEI